MSTSPTYDNSEFGRFEGILETIWLNNGRDMKLKNDFAYFDPLDKKWFATAGSIVDGASIPKPFWSLIGGPFEGQYRNASVIHDVACVEMKEPWKNVHRMFYGACRCGGVGEIKAKIMYYAVFRFGPRWKPVYEERIEKGKKVTTQRFVREIPVVSDQIRITKAVNFIETNNPSLEEIENLDL